MNNKIVVLGGGTGQSILLSGLKKFPFDITSVVSVCDDGSSTGRLRNEFNVPAMGDIRRVLIALSEKEDVFEKMFNYRFKTNGDFDGHTVGNIILTALADMENSFSNGIERISEILNLKGRVLPLTDDNVVLMADMEDGTVIEGEHHITETNAKIKRVYYKEEAVATKEALEASKETTKYKYTLDISSTPAI